jgi:hypothetical protein
MWLAQVRRKAARPPHLAALETALKTRLAAMPRPPHAGLRGLVRRAGHLELQLRPTAWVCTIVFVVGGCFVHRGLGALYGGCIAALLWPLVAREIRRVLRPLVTP